MYVEKHIPKNKKYFDTEHHHVVKWDLDHLDEAADDKSTIRAALPDQAKMPDD